MCWNEAGTTPCAELGKENFLFPEKSSYIRGRSEKEGDSPKHPTTVRFLSWTQGPGSACSRASASRFLTLGSLSGLLPPHIPARACASSHLTSQGCQEEGPCSSLLPARDYPQEEARLLGK